MVDIPIAIATFKTIIDIAQGMKDLRDSAAINAAVIELQNKILAAQGEQFALIDQIRNLEQKVVTLEKWDTEKQRYELKDIGQGCVAYGLKADVQSSEPVHYLCANCYSDNKKRFLQFRRESRFRSEVYSCQGCGSQLYTIGHP